MEYKRQSYIDQLASLRGTSQIKIITGMRRCGKSYLLNVLFKRFLLESGVPESHIIEVSFEGLSNKKMRDPYSFLDFINSKITADIGPRSLSNDAGKIHIKDGSANQYYLLLDEIQLLSDFAEVLNDIARRQNVDIYVTGSNAKFLSKDVVTEFRGRGYEIHMYPLSFSEYAEERKQDPRATYRDYMTYGGLPAVTLLEQDEQKVNYLLSVYNETFIQDIIERNNLRKSNALTELLQVLYSNIACLTSLKKIAQTYLTNSDTPINMQTVQAYLNHFLDAFMFEKALRYDVKGRKYIGAQAKYYATDLGLRNAGIHFRQIEPTHILENIIYNELRMRGFAVDVGMVPTLVRNNGRAERRNYEIDFVCSKASQRLYIQSALTIAPSEKFQKEQRPFAKVDDSFKKIIITRDETVAHYTEQGVLILNVLDFLIDRHSLQKF